MTRNFTKDEVETVILQAILSRPPLEVGRCKVHILEQEGEELVVKNMEKTQEVTNLTDLEEALNDENVSRIYIPKFASVTSKGLKNVLNRASLSKNIYCAFNVNI